jgi:hypothetical protein
MRSFWNFSHRGDLFFPHCLKVSHSWGHPRAAFVREATRFKTMHNLVDVPARDSQVIDGAVCNATVLHLPETIAKAVFSAIINASLSFELCVVCVPLNFSRGDRTPLTRAQSLIRSATIGIRVQIGHGNPSFGFIPS